MVCFVSQERRSKGWHPTWKRRPVDRCLGQRAAVASFSRPCPKCRRGVARYFIRQCGISNCGTAIRCGVTASPCCARLGFRVRPIGTTDWATWHGLRCFISRTELARLDRRLDGLGRRFHSLFRQWNGRHWCRCLELDWILPASGLALSNRGSFWVIKEITSRSPLEGGGGLNHIWKEIAHLALINSSHLAVSQTNSRGASPDFRDDYHYSNFHPGPLLFRRTRSFGAVTDKNVNGQSVIVFFPTQRSLLSYLIYFKRRRYVWKCSHFSAMPYQHWANPQPSGSHKEQRHFPTFHR